MTTLLRRHPGAHARMRRAHSLSGARTPLKVLALAASAALVCAGLVTTGALAASAVSSGTLLLKDSFTKSSVTSSEYVVGGTGTVAGASANVACLTAAGSTTSDAPTRCASGATDASDGGALRLTTAEGSQTGFLLYNHALPTRAGLDIQFNMYQYGGNGADGITFFLSDGQHELDRVGASGGSLGYHNSTAGSGIGQKGIPYALLGVAFDAYGNFVYETNNVADGGSCADHSADWSKARAPQSVSLRGPGKLGSDGTWDDGYCLLGAPVAPAGGIDLTSTTTRDAALRKVKIEIDPPSTTSPKVRVYLGAMGDANATPQLVTTVDEPAEFATTKTFKFGWSASTGGSTDIHEINMLNVASINEITPVIEVTATNPSPADAGSESNVTFSTSTSSSDGPIAAGVPVTMTVTSPTNMTLGTLPAAINGWSLGSNTSTSAVYTYTPDALVVPGTALPDLTLPVTSTTPGTYNVSAIVSGAGIDTATSTEADRTGTSTVTVRPIAGDGPVAGQSATATTAPASATPAVTTIPVPDPVGVGTPTYSIASGPTRGAATIDSATGVISYTPAAGMSGISRIEYVVEMNGQTSLPATVTVTTPPAASDISTATGYATPITVDLATTSVGTGLTFALVSAPPTTAGTATVDSATGALVFTPASAFSGSTTMTYRVTDADSVSSATAAVTIAVGPRAHDDSLSVSLDKTGNGTVSSTLPAVDGSGPFTYTLVDDTAAGTVALAADGSFTYTAKKQTTGTFTATYTATGASGAPNEDSAVLTVIVKPYAGMVSATTRADTSVTAALTTQGAEGGTFTITQPGSGAGAAALGDDPATLIFTPAAGTSGIATFLYTVSANGVTSDAATVSISVCPVVTDKTASTPYGRTATVDLTGGARGTALTYSMVSGASAAGAASVDAATGLLTFAPKVGFSGIAAITFRATDAAGLASDVKTVTLTVLPEAQSSAATVTLPPSGAGESSFDVPQPAGTGPFHFELVPGSTTPGGSFAIDESTGRVTFTPEPGVSGHVQAKYRVTDAAGNTSNAQDVTVTVLPFSRTPNTAQDVGSATHELVAAQTVGTGPFVYALVDAPDPTIGAARIDAARGLITFEPADRTASGRVSFTYTVTDAAGVTSTPSPAMLQLRPTVTDLSGSTQGALANPLPAVLTPAPVGTGPFTYRLLSTAPHANVAGTGAAFAVTPADGYSGTTAFTFVAVDVHGVESAVRTATVVVAGIPGGLAKTGVDVPGAAALGAVMAILLGAGLVLAMRLRRRQSARRQSGRRPTTTVA
ncbi:tandem-95 repeat protein [Microbacterium sp. STN6]|uniref:Ig-like domain-containing protein n=1 Tax=Microbacterium sp. STN6 TaxID=2995588 RepID=UPI0022609475|nr:tandem-95 repeat protein [Microbacterium sp. STN6]MCX7522719.1 tandem-95 repeat protein [Microbacterium sp. STN6]